MRSFVALSFLTAILVGCARESAPTEATSFSRPDRGASAVQIAPSKGAPVVLISIDTLRSDRLPAYGYDGVDTPAIDRFRADAILAEQCFAHYPMTLPSHVSLLTGQLPTETGVRDNAGYRLPEGYIPYLPTLLQQEGYATGAFVSSFVLRGAMGLAQGFDHYDDQTQVTRTANFWGPERDGHQTLAATLPWLEEHAARPFFLFFHLYEPHLPFEPPEPYRSRWGASYEGEIATVDAIVGELLDELRRLGVYDDSLILFFADHGEGLDDHGEEGHGVFLYREAIQVPLIVKLPGNRRAGETITTPTQLIDVLPTIGAVLGIPLPDEMTGSSVLMLSEEDQARPIFAETQYPRLHFGWSDLASVVLGSYHYIDAPRPELYDLSKDPAETDNVLTDQLDVAAEDIAGTLRRHVEQFRRPLEAPKTESAEVVQQLAALGYLADSESVTEGPLPDPKDQIAHSRAQMEIARELIEEGRAHEATEVLRELLEVNPKSSEALFILARVLEQDDRLEESLIIWQRAFELSRGGPQVAVRLGRVLLKLGRIDEARNHVALAGALDPRLARELAAEIALAGDDIAAALKLIEQTPEVRLDLKRRVGLALSRAGQHHSALALLLPLSDEGDETAVRNTQAIALTAAGRGGEALLLLDQILQEVPDDSLALETRGLCMLEAGRLRDARRQLERAVELDPQAANAWNLLGVARFQMDQQIAALEAWKKAVELDPTQLDALYNLAFTAAQLGLDTQAREHLHQYVERAPAERYAREIAAARSLLSQLGPE